MAFTQPEMVFLMSLIKSRKTFKVTWVLLLLLLLLLLLFSFIIIIIYIFLTRT